MLLVFSSLITIGRLKLTFVSELKVRSTWQEMTGKAMIKIAKRILVKDSLGKLQKLQDVIKVGDPVTIQIGYGDRLNTEFVGYVSRSPRPSLPVEINCEDEMWKVKRKRITQTVFSNGKLSDLIKTILPEYETDLFDTSLGSDYSSLTDATGTAAQALKKVEDTFGLKAFFRLVPTATGTKQILVIGKPYSSFDLLNAKPVLYKLRVNTKADSLEYKFKDDNPIQIKGVAKIDDGKDLKSDYPKGEVFEGSTKTVHFPVTIQAELDKLVKDEWQRLNVDRFEGSVTGFAFPFARHGEVANVVDQFYEPMDNLNFIDTVEVTVDVNGGVQRICTLGYVANGNTQSTTR